MKKVLLTVSFAAISGIIFGQINTQNIQRKEAKNVFAGETPVQNGTDVERAIIWQNDFSVPADWVLSNTGNPSANWVIGTTPPAGQFSVGMGAITSTTAANNFAMFDSDGLGSGTSTQNAVVEFDDPIDLTGHPAVLVEFQSYYRHFTGGACYLEVSTNGTNWTSFPVHADVAVNSATANPATVVVNVTGVIGGSANAYVRFRYQGAWEYAWMIDDVKISDAPDNDLVLGNVYYGIYSKYPVGQELPMDFSGKVTNFGGTAQTNVTLNVTVNGTSFGTSPAVASLAVGATDSLVVPGSYTPSGVGNYSLVFTADQDQTDATPATNTKTQTVSVTNYTFARDNNNYDGAGTWNGENNGYIIGNLFEVSNDATATSIDVVLQGNTEAGAQFRVVLLNDLLDDGAGGSALVAESDFHTVVASEIPSGASSNPTAIKVPFIVPADIQAGEYIVAVDFGGGTEQLVLAEGSDIVQPIQTTFIYDLTETPPDWFYITSTPMIRLNLNEPDNSSVEENSNASVNVFPNPTSDYINVTFGEINGDVTMTMFSTDGKQVILKNANVVSGQNMMMDVADLAAGTYTLRVVSANGTFVKKVVIK